MNMMGVQQVRAGSDQSGRRPAPAQRRRGAQRRGGAQRGGGQGIGGAIRGIPTMGDMNGDGVPDMMQGGMMMGHRGGMGMGAPPRAD